MPLPSISEGVFRYTGGLLEPYNLKLLIGLQQQHCVLTTSLCAFVCVYLCGAFCKPVSLNGLQDCFRGGVQGGWGRKVTVHASCHCSDPTTRFALKEVVMLPVTPRIDCRHGDTAP